MGRGSLQGNALASALCPFVSVRGGEGRGREGRGKGEGERGGGEGKTQEHTRQVLHTRVS